MSPRSVTPPPLSPIVKEIAAVPPEWRWHVAHVKSRAEKQFAWDMASLGVVYFLPMERVVRVNNRKSETRYLPVYPGYVFFAGASASDDEKAELFDRVYFSRKICGVIETAHQAALRREIAIAALAFGTTIDTVAPAVDGQIAVGRRYRVKDSHPWLADQYGYVDAVSGKGIVHIHITLLGASRPTEVGAEWLEPADIRPEAKPE